MKVINKAGIFLFLMLILFGCHSNQNSTKDNKGNANGKNLDYKVVLDTVMSKNTDSTSWFSPIAGVIPGTPSTIVMTIQEYHKGFSDSYGPVLTMVSTDNGKNWSAPRDKGNAFAFHKESNNVLYGVCNFTPKWNQHAGVLLGTANSYRTRNKKFVGSPYNKRVIPWSVYNPKTGEWSPWQGLNMPDDSIFYQSLACADQRVDLSNGQILLPIYCKAKEDKRYKTTVIQCSFDGEQLNYEKHGNFLTVDIARGLFEPSLTYFGGRYYLTIRNDKNGYHSVSKDGLHFNSPKIWHFDNGEEVGTYNTMQHWVTHSDGLYLVYTRRGEHNDYVVRNRAPLFMARVDTSRMVLLKNTERVIIPNRGAPLGNFGVVKVNKQETWITVAEVMQGRGEEKYGARGNVYIARIRWNRPNLNL